MAMYFVLFMIIGCMFASKTTRLLEHVRKATIQGHTVVIFKPKTDDRTGRKTIRTHDGQEIEVQIAATAKHIRKWIKDNPSITFVGIDEIQFFDAGIVEVISHLTFDLGLLVSIVGLPTDFKRDTFGFMGEISLIANFVEKLHAVCMHDGCGASADWTQRNIGGVPAYNDEPVVYLGAKKEGYLSMCGDHHEFRVREKVKI